MVSILASKKKYQRFDPWSSQPKANKIDIDCFQFAGNTKE